MPASPSSTSVSPSALRDLFLDMIAAERGAAKNTLDAYRRDLVDYLGFLAERADHPASVGTERVRDYILKLDRDGLKPASAARRLSALRQFHKFMFAEGHRPTDPTTVLEGPRRGRPLPKVLRASTRSSACSLRPGPASTTSTVRPWRAGGSHG